MNELKSEMNRMFRHWRNAHRGEEGVLVCTGPSLKRFDEYGYAMSDEPIYLGVNESIYTTIPLDYLFVQDTKPGHKYGYAKKPYCYDHYPVTRAKFAGKAPMIPTVHTIPFKDISKHGWWAYEIGREGVCEFQKDIDTFKLGDGNSVAFSAAQFALYTGISTLYLVGVDITVPTTIKDKPPVEGFNPYTHWDHFGNWYKFKQWASEAYPDVKIVSVNPVGLKGMFEEIEI